MDVEEDQFTCIQNNIGIAAKELSIMGFGQGNNLEVLDSPNQQSPI